MAKKTRIDLALSLDIHRSYGMAEVWKFIFDARNNHDGKANKKALYDQIDADTLDMNKDSYPFLRKFLNRILINEKWIANHIASLTFVMLWDILSERQPTVKRALPTHVQLAHTPTANKNVLTGKKEARVERKCQPKASHS
jgi:hypothetical protein